MDLGFARFEQWRRGASPLALDHARLIASLAIAQATSATARAEALLAIPGHPIGSQVDALACVMRAQPGWANAAASLAGSFDPRRAAGLAARPSSSRQVT